MVPPASNQLFEARFIETVGQRKSRCDDSEAELL